MEEAEQRQEELQRVIEKQKEEERRKEKEDELQRRIIGAKSILSVLNRGVDRHIACRDPVIRATLLFDKLCLIIDMFGATITNVNSDFPDDLKNQITEASDRVNEELDYIFQYILSPSYSPESNNAYSGRSFGNVANDTS
jgi:hypothetical protein